MITIIAILTALQITSMIINTCVFFIEYSKSGIITLENLVIFCVRLLPIVSIISAIAFCADFLNRNSDMVIYKRKEKK